MNKELKLAQLNGQSENLRKQKIIKGVKQRFDHNDEIAILRKTIIILANIIKEQHPHVDLSEVFDYNTFVESQKIQVNKEELYD